MTSSALEKLAVVAQSAAPASETTETADVTEAHTLVGHSSPDIECCAGHFALSCISVFRNHFRVSPKAESMFIAAGPLRKEDWAPLGFTSRVDGKLLETKGFRFFDCGGGELDQHGRLDTLQQQFSSLDLMIMAAKADFVPDQTVYVRDPVTGADTDVVDHVIPGQPGDAEFMATAKYLFELISKNDLTGADIVVDHEVKSSKWPHSQRTLRNFVTAFNLAHPKRPDVVVDTMRFAFNGALIYAEQQAKIAAGNPDAVLADLPEDVRTKIARHAFLMPNIIEALAVYGEETQRNFVRDYEAAFDLYEAEWLDAERDYYDPKKTQVHSGVENKLPERRRVDNQGNEYFEPITVVVTISSSQRIGAVCRRGNWSKDRGKSRKDQSNPARRGADVVVHFDGTNQRRFTVSTNDISLREVAAAVRAADAIAKGVRGMNPQHVKQMMEPGHGTVSLPDGTKIQLLYLAEFEKAFGHLRSNPHSEPTALSKAMVGELVRRALKEGLTLDLAWDILKGRVLDR
jgi:hypothetical protein